MDPKSINEEFSRDLQFIRQVGIEKQAIFGAIGAVARGVGAALPFIKNVFPAVVRGGAAAANSPIGKAVNTASTFGSFTDGTIGALTQAGQAAVNVGKKGVGVTNRVLNNPIGSTLPFVGLSLGPAAYDTFYTTPHNNFVIDNENKALGEQYNKFYNNATPEQQQELTSVADGIRAQYSTGMAPGVDRDRLVEHAVNQHMLHNYINKQTDPAAAATQPASAGAQSQSQSQSQDQAQNPETAAPAAPAEVNAQAAQAAQSAGPFQSFTEKAKEMLHAAPEKVKEIAHGAQSTVTNALQNPAIKTDVDIWGKTGEIGQNLMTNATNMLSSVVQDPKQIPEILKNMQPAEIVGAGLGLSALAIGVMRLLGGQGGLGSVLLSMLGAAGAVAATGNAFGRGNAGGAATGAPAEAAAAAPAPAATPALAGALAGSAAPQQMAAQNPGALLDSLQNNPKFVQALPQINAMAQRGMFGYDGLGKSAVRSEIAKQLGITDPQTVDSLVAEYRRRAGL